MDRIAFGMDKLHAFSGKGTLFYSLLNDLDNSLESVRNEWENPHDPENSDECKRQKDIQIEGSTEFYRLWSVIRFASSIQLSATEYSIR